MDSAVPLTVFVIGLVAGIGVIDAAGVAPERCLKAPPIKSDYTPSGIMWKLDDLEIYETKNKTPKIIISAYDIFGFHVNTKQFADILAAEGDFRVIMPDFLRGSPLDPNNFPPKE